jgi:hypothetical protein
VVFVGEPVEHRNAGELREGLDAALLRRDIRWRHMRPSTRAVSLKDLLVPDLRTGRVQYVTRPGQHATSNEQRVRVELFSKIRQISVFEMLLFGAGALPA